MTFQLTQMMTADLDPLALIRIVRSELKNGKAPGLDKVCNESFKKAVGTGFFTHLAEPLPYH